MNKKEQVIEMAKNLNNRVEAGIINIPILEGFDIIENVTEPNIIFAAISENRYIEQLIVGDTLKENETLEDKVKETIKISEEYMEKQDLEYAQDNFIHLRDYNNNFKFKVYIQDYIFKDSSERRAIRQINAYFIEPEYNKFYQLSISTGPIGIPTKMLKMGKIDLQNDLITRELVLMMETLITNIKYK